MQIVLKGTPMVVFKDSAQILKKEVKSIRIKKMLKYFSYYEYKDSGNDRDFTGIEKYIKYKGKKIRSVEIKILPPFGNTEEDTIIYNTKAQKFGNKIHFISKEKYVKNDILFKKGDKVNPVLFADTEKLLWDRKKFKDIRILLTEDKTSGELDVVVYLRDNLSWIVGLGYNDRLIFGISTYNFFGQPNTLSLFTGINMNKYNLWAIGGAYKYENIRNSQINFNTSFLIEKLNKQTSVSLNRNFFSIKTKWAFNLQYSYGNNTNSLTRNMRDTATYIKANSNSYSAWLAYALPLYKIIPIKDDKLKLIVAGKLDNTYYKNRPFLTSTFYDKIFINQQNFRFGIGVVRWDYYLARNSFYLEVAEYFPRGYSTSFWVGYQLDEVYRRRTSLDFTVNYGIHVKNLGYFYPQFNFSGYINKGRGEQMVSTLSMDYVSDKITIAKKVHFRQILKARSSLGVLVPEERYFNVNESNGIRGFYAPVLKGSKSISVNAEWDLFFDKKIATAKVMTYLFCDMAWISENKKRIVKQSIFQYGLGLGLRIRSEALGVPFLDLQLSVYPKGRGYANQLFEYRLYDNNRNAIRPNNMFYEYTSSVNINR